MKKYTDGTLAVGLILLITLGLVYGQCKTYGQWDYVGESGVPSMHGILEPNTNKVVFVARVKFDGQPKINGKNVYSTEMDLDTFDIRALTVLSNTFCSAGGYLPDGEMVNLGGAESASDSKSMASVTQGFNKARRMDPCADSKCDWVQDKASLSAFRWYPTVEKLADGRLFVAGGSSKGTALNRPEVNMASFEIYPQDGRGNVSFPFLAETLPFNLYPMVHLLTDGNLFVLANTKAIIFDTKTWALKKRLDDLPGPPRNYPLTAGSVVLPLSAKNPEVEILVCGGSKEFDGDSPAEDTCGRIKPLAADPKWAMEEMPSGRLMPDLVILANGQILILNGCKKGAAGFAGKGKEGSDPVLVPHIYDYQAAEGKRFSKLQPSYIPRMYHSIAMTTQTGQVLVSGSNPNDNFKSSGPFPTEYRVEMFTPPFLCSQSPRPIINKSPPKAKYDTSFVVEVTTFSKKPSITANILTPGFVTHSTHMGQRMAWLTTRVKGNTITISSPDDSATAPPGPYLLFILDNDVPSIAAWITLEK